MRKTVNTICEPYASAQSDQHLIVCCLDSKIPIALNPEFQDSS